MGYRVEIYSDTAATRHSPVRCCVLPQVFDTESDARAALDKAWRNLRKKFGPVAGQIVIE